MLKDQSKDTRYGEQNPLQRKLFRAFDTSLLSAHAEVDYHSVLVN